jgi:hypothetical protein
MGLHESKVQSIFIGPYILPSANEKKRSAYQGRRYEQKRKGKKEEEVIYQEAQSTSSWTRGLES